MNGSLLPHGGGPPFISTRGGSTRALDKDAIIGQQRKLNLLGRDGGDNNDKEDVNLHTADDLVDKEEATSDPVDDTLYVIKKDGTREPLDKNKVGSV